MSLWPTFITGVVGVAGILGTIVAARMTTKSQTANLLLSFNEERRRAQRTEKRQVYAEFLASIHEVVDTTTASHFTGDMQKVLDAILHEVLPVRSQVYTRLGTLELIARDEVTSQARAIADYVCGSYGDLTLKIKKGTRKLEELETADKLIDEMEAQLLKAMRADLGGEI